VDEVINQADPSAVTELATTSYAAAHHETNLRMQSAFPDAHMSIEDIIADDHNSFPTRGHRASARRGIVGFLLCFCERLC
jgi:hypothetical protein